MADYEKVKEIKKQHEKEWMAVEGVVAIGIGKVDNQNAIIISVSEKVEKVRKEIDERINNVPVKIQQTGKFKAL